MKTLYSKDSKGNLRVWSIYTEGAEVVVKHGQYMGKIQEKRYTAGVKNYREYNNAQELIGKVIEVEFEDFSDDGVPCKPTGIGVREVDEYGRPVI